MTKNKPLTIQWAARELRSRLGLSQQAMATRLEVSMAAIRNYESGKTLKPDIGVLSRYDLIAKFSRNPDVAEVFSDATGEAMKIPRDKWRMIQYLNHVTDEEGTILAAALATLRGEPPYRRYRETLVEALKKPWQTFQKRGVPAK